MSHAGRQEAGDLHMKKLRKGKKKEAMKLAQMSEEDRAEYLHNKFEKSLKDICGIIMWDWENHQLPYNKHIWAVEKMEARLKEIEDNIPIANIEIDGINKREIYQNNNKLEVTRIKECLERLKPND